MKISHKFPQFTNQPTLIAVTGKQGGRFYIARDGIIEEVDSFKIEKPGYTDREGMFMTRGRGITVRSGSVVEEQDEVMLRYFFHEFISRIRQLSANLAPDKLVLFGTAGMKGRLSKLLPKHLQEKIDVFIVGTYYGSHPFKLLAKIQEHRAEQGRQTTKPIYGEAKKIMDQTRIARRVIRGR
jgi:hypothetical protein